MYDSCGFDVSGVDSKHYLADEHVVDIEDGTIESDDQHATFRVFHQPPEPCHEYVRDYLETTETI